MGLSYAAPRTTLVAFAVLIGAAGSCAAVRRGAWSAVDVTSLVAAGDDEVTLAITTYGRREISFGSRESRSGPRLVVRADDEAEDHVLDAILRR